MYLLPELLLFSPLIVYALFRTRKLIERNLYKNLFTAFSVFLALGYPAAECLAHVPFAARVKYPMLAGFYCLPFLLYFVLVFALSSLIIGFLRTLKIISGDTVRRRGFRLAQLWLLLVLPGVIVAFGAVNNDRLQIRKYSVEVPRKSSQTDHLKIAFASDFHLGDMTSADLMERFVEKANAQDPDVVLIGGDVLEGDRLDDQMNSFKEYFRRLRSRYGVYAVPGNHERGGDRTGFFQSSGIRLLQDSVENVGGTFYLAGRNDSRVGNRKSIDDLLLGTPDDLPVILLDHRPTDLERVSESRVDIQLSGHTHEGQLFPVNFITRNRYELSWGYLRKKHTHFFVTSGIQVWGPPVRTAGASEILVIDVAFRGADSALATGH